MTGGGLRGSDSKGCLKQCFEVEGGIAGKIIGRSIRPRIERERALEGTKGSFEGALVGLESSAKGLKSDLGASPSQDIVDLGDRTGNYFHLIDDQNPISYCCQFVDRFHRRCDHHFLLPYFHCKMVESINFSEGLYPDWFKFHFHFGGTIHMGHMGSLNFLKSGRPEQLDLRYWHLLMR